MSQGHRLQRHERINRQTTLHKLFWALAAGMLLVTATLSAAPVHANETAGQKIDRIAGKTGDGIRNGAEWAGSGIRKGVMKTGEGLSKGAAFVANGVRKGVEKTGEGLSRAGDKIQQAAGDNA
jgi:hypothetical protein